jgi:hypothetical protein
MPAPTSASTTAAPPDPTTALTLPAETAKPPTPVSSFPAPTVPLTDNRVFLVGDSVLEAAGPHYGNRLGQVLGPLGWRATVDAVQGRPPEDAIRVLRTRRREIGQVVVILIGNNYGGDETAFAGQVAQMLSILNSVPEIVVLTVEEFKPLQAQVNVELRRAAAVDPRVVLVDWDTVVRSTPGANLPDGLHLTALGASVLAATIASTLGPAP